MKIRYLEVQAFAISCDTPHALKRGGFLGHAFPTGIR